MYRLWVLAVKAMAWILPALCVLGVAGVPPPSLFVACGGGCVGSPQSRRGAAEVRRLLYRLTGELPALIIGPEAEAPGLLARYPADGPRA